MNQITVNCRCKTITEKCSQYRQTKLTCGYQTKEFFVILLGAETQVHEIITLIGIQEMRVVEQYG
jgi:hypothetical protein